jgi:hypothetical protein
MREESTHMTRGEVYKVIAWLIGIALTIYGIIIGFIKAQIKDVQDVVEKVDTKFDMLTSEAQNHVERLVKLETQQTSTDKALGKIEGKLDSLINRFGIPQ